VCRYSAAITSTSKVLHNLSNGLQRALKFRSCLQITKFNSEQIGLTVVLFSVNFVFRPRAVDKIIFDERYALSYITYRIVFYPS